MTGPEEGHSTHKAAQKLRETKPAPGRKIAMPPQRPGWTQEVARHIKQNMFYCVETIPAIMNVDSCPDNSFHGFETLISMFNWSVNKEN